MRTRRLMMIASCVGALLAGQGPALGAGAPQVARVNVSSGGAQADADSGTYRPFISARGRYVGFVSAASNLVPDDTNGVNDVFVRDRQTSRTRR